MQKKVILVTGSNRGIGKEIVRQLAAQGDTVYAGGRELAKVEAAVQEYSGTIIPVKLEVTSGADRRALAQKLEQESVQLDGLINNAGIMGNDGAAKLNIEQFRAVMEVNFFAIAESIRDFLPLLQKSDDPRVINMSSGLGEVAGMAQGGYAAYRLSKLALNGLTMLLHAEWKETIKIFSMCPGWVRTDMGGPDAHRDVTQGADTAVWLMRAEAPNGKFFRDRKVIPW
jgi:NAD(P)-dependent dehydrogenase (short-subunit alcohol dehydrogenase family)